MERFNLKKLHEAEGKQQYRVEVSSRLAVLEHFDTEMEINNSAWLINRETINISAKECLSYFKLKNHKPWFNEGCSKLVDERKQAKLLWLQDLSETNGDNLKIVRHKASRYSRNKKWEHREKQN
jgi:hypothetical protein